MMRGVRTIGGGGGGGGGNPGRWGPDFGAPSPQVGVSPDLVSLALTGNVQAATLVALTALTLSGGVPVGVATLLSVAVSHTLSCGVRPQGSLDVVYPPLQVAAAVAAPLMALAAERPVGVAPAMPELALAANLGCRCRVSQLLYQTSDILAHKDVWVPTTVGCLDNGNKNNQDLQIEGVTVTSKVAYAGWNLANFPTGATVTDATVTLDVKTAGLTDPNGRILRITTASETWSESTVTCSNRPPADNTGVFHTFPANFTGPKFVSLGTDFTTRIRDRMGVGSFSVLITANSALTTNFVLFSKDGGTNHAAGPKLRFSFTVPV